MANDTRRIPVTAIRPNPAQPRLVFDKRALSRLAATIRQHGLLQPVVVRQVLGMRGYELVAGERRLRAVKLLGWKTVPAVVVRAADQESAEMALVENIAREGLNPLDEGRSLKVLLDAGETYRGLAVRLGKDKSYVQNRVRLLSMPAEVRALVRRRPELMTHAYLLSRVRDPRLRRYPLSFPCACAHATGRDRASGETRRTPRFRAR